jgi:hypothetical protein
VGGTGPARQNEAEPTITPAKSSGGKVRDHKS